MAYTIALLASEGEPGFNPLDLSHGGGLFWTVVIFLVALVPIWKMVMGPITKALEARDDKAAAAIASAEKASRDAGNALAAVESKLKEAQVESTKLVEAARARGEAVERQIKDDANKAATQMIERAKSEIKNEEAKALSAIRREVVDVSMNAAGQVLKRKVDGADDRRLVEELVSAAGKEARS
ncbi:MAG: F0F1 ATP synthase subunit B [Planctomycetota bacterium]|nr:F0F1 ATP synthase subunit B [Planctomycetota bacterium]